MDLVSSSPSVAALWERIKEACGRHFGLPLQEVIQDNPSRLHLFNNALEVEKMCESCCRTMPNHPECSPRNRIVSHDEGVMNLSYITQPCMVAAQLLALKYIETEDRDYVSKFCCVTGHSLGEFTALAALGVFPPEVAACLTFKRGLLMEHHLGLIPTQNFTGKFADREKYRLYACDPSRAKLDENPETADDIFFCMVELIAQSLSQSTSFLEVVNFNVPHQQYVVAGDMMGLAVLGKCLDPMYRVHYTADSTDNSINIPALVHAALRSCVEDKKSGFLNMAEKSSKDFVTSSARRYGVRQTFHRFVHGPDDGCTPAPSELSHLTLEECGRSGLKRKSWFIPLRVEIPFHSSRLRQAMDDFLPVVLNALPEEKVLRQLLCADGKKGVPIWVTNLTGRSFLPFDKSFQDSVKEAMSSMNIGEVRHVGRYHTDTILRKFEESIAKESVSGMCASVLAAQLARPVMWISSMKELVVQHRVSEIHEISPTRNLTEMFRRSYTFFTKEALDASPPTTFASESFVAKCFPADKMFFERLDAAKE